VAKAAIIAERAGWPVPLGRHAAAVAGVEQSMASAASVSILSELWGWRVLM
jgi:hypothetical protein